MERKRHAEGNRKECAMELNDRQELSDNLSAYARATDQICVY